MYEYYVYIYLPENRILTTSKEINNEDYLLIANGSSNSKEVSDCIAKAYAMGIVRGAERGVALGKPMKNKLEEFDF